jgi:hypothetical protein
MLARVIRFAHLFGAIASGNVFSLRSSQPLGQLFLETSFA